MSEPFFTSDSVEPPFRYKRDPTGRIHINGEIDMASVIDLQPLLIASRTPIELDLTGVTFIDSSGVNALLHARQVRPVRIVASSKAVDRVLDTLGLSVCFQS